eukprot:Em0009g826a
MCHGLARSRQIRCHAKGKSKAVDSKSTASRSLNCSDTTSGTEAVTLPAVTRRLPEAARADGTKGGVIRRGIIRITTHWGLPYLHQRSTEEGSVRRIRKAMLQYQSTICQLFSTFGPVAALKYDKLFRCTKDQTLRWDNLKEGLLSTLGGFHEELPELFDRAARYGDQPRFQAAGDGVPSMAYIRGGRAAQDRLLLQTYKCSIMRAPAVEGFLEAVYIRSRSLRHSAVSMSWLLELVELYDTVINLASMHKQASHLPHSIAVATASICRSRAKGRSKAVECTLSTGQTTSRTVAAPFSPQVTSPFSSPSCPSSSHWRRRHCSVTLGPSRALLANIIIQSTLTI